MNEFFKYDTCMLYMYMLRETLLLDTNPPLSCDTSCRQLFKVEIVFQTTRTFDNYVFENQVKKVIIFCQFKKIYSSCQRTKMISQNIILTYGHPLVVILHQMSDQWCSLSLLTC